MKMQGVLPPWLEKLNFIKLLIISGIFLKMGLLFGFVTPPLFKSFLKSKINLMPGSELRELYVKTPFYLNFRVYLFNLTNPDEVSEGGKPKVQQVGPYFFEEWKEKFDLIDNDEEDTLTYSFKNTFKFRPDLSSGLTGDEIITMPHPLIATMLLAINVDKKPMLSMLQSAIDILLSSPQHVFYTGRVMDILYDGIPVDCSSEKFHAKAVCSAFEGGEVKAVRRVNETHYAFSLLSQGNGTDLGELRVFRGWKNSEDMGRVVAFNDEPEMDTWSGDECNEYRGTDSTIFPPYMDKKKGIWAYEPSVCRAMGAHYVGKSEYMGVETDEFAIDIGSKENAKECYCRKEDECPKRGTFDLFPCLGAPMIASQPHFYGADPSLVENFASGIKPVKEDHAIYMHFEMTTGTPMKAAKRLQFNLDIVPIEKVPYMSKLREMYYPMFWIEESVAMDQSYVDQVKNSVILAIQIQKILKWTGIIIGLSGIILASVLLIIAKQSGSQKTPPPSAGTKNEA